MILNGGLCAAVVMSLSAQEKTPAPATVQTQTQPNAQASAGSPRRQISPQSSVTVDGSEAMFTTMCALLAAGFESNVSSDNWIPFRA